MQKTPFDLSGQHVVIVGGSSGIGKATADLAIRLGARVTIASRSRKKLDTAMADIGLPERLDCQVVDQTSDDSVTALCGTLPDESVNHLIITASAAVHGSFAELPLADASAMFESKLWGPYRLARAFLPKMASGGSITFFSGVLSRRPGMNCSALGAVNAAVEGLTRGLALELGPRLRVNCCSPGMVRSEAYDKLPEDAREAMYASTGASLPVGRVGSTVEIATAVVALMSNAYVTGQVVDVDGGHMVRQYATA